ncbi:acyl-CoA carboxylase subunit epsilon [Arthrobacter sp. 35W]|uniref:acyl-CoA carboxylase subunit epsilon n=1 Tax=Arthrobacter sp. 35W TaxID=1132441 RepID=UPI00041E9101|nr:acyl-CoA carboxylase subunit epsilon [Arthrobacter sp. 35W]
MTANQTPLVEPTEAPGTPLLTVAKGNPTPEELAALTAVVLSLQSVDEEPEAKPATRAWVRRAQLNLGPKPGPGAWRRSRT